jgi:hypothetical protein
MGEAHSRNGRLETHKHNVGQNIGRELAIWTAYS